MKPERPVVAATTPVAVELLEGRKIYWCACGRSRTQPFCDGSHSGTGLSPRPYVPPESRTYRLCCCKQTSTPPLCDGSHERLSRGGQVNPLRPAAGAPKK